MWTKPENPTVSKPIVTNIGRLTATVTPGKVIDDGGKPIVEVETYIMGGKYGNAYHSIGKGTGNINLSGLEPNTTYKVVTRASNGITEYYSLATVFTTLGNPPTITDLYATDVTLTSAKIKYTATYDHNAEFNKFVVQWRYKGDTTWNTLGNSVNKITNVSNLNVDIIEYRIIVTDNWNRSTTSKVLTYFIEEDLSNYVSDLKVITNFDDTYTVSATWNQKVYNKLEYAYILGKDKYQSFYDRVGIELKSNSGISVKTKAFKNKKTNKLFQLVLKVSSCNYVITKDITINRQNYDLPVTLIKSNGNKSKFNMSPVVKIQSIFPQIKALREHDFVKLSKYMRYIYIDSRGYEDKNPIYSQIIEKTIGKITIKIDLRYVHLTGPIYQYNIYSIKLKSSDGSKIRIRNGGVILTIDNIFCASINNLILNSTYQSANDTRIDGNVFLINNETFNLIPKINITLNPEFDFQDTTRLDINLPSKSISYANHDIINNHLLEIQVFDVNGNNISSGKDVKLSDGSNPICPFGTNTKSATNGITNNPQLSIYSNNELPLVLDLGKEYKIGKIKIWRKYGDSHIYYRNYIIGRNNNKEICYIFFDSNNSDGYKETNNGKEFIVK